MDSVAATAGLAKGSLYNYFQDKDKLVRFLYAQLVEPFFQVIEEIADGDLPASEIGRDTPRNRGAERQGQGHHPVAAGDTSGKTGS